MNKLIAGIFTAALLGTSPAVAADVQTTKLLEDVLSAVNNSANAISTLKAKILTLEAENTKLFADMEKLTFDSRAGSGSIPPGAVVVFAKPCPTDLGWSIYEPATARVIIGAGAKFDPKHRTWKRQRPGGGFEEANLTVREFRSSDGEETHALAITEMPSHSHPIRRTDKNSGNGNYVNWKSMGSPYNKSTGDGTSDVGRGDAHNNMPPYIALYYCKKG